ncbi:lytic transglycosylase domain-containing protein [Candidatus Woesearchaeota archaeon]|nr:lytic transglycosylase domain-containing protein [Candidatus Woesearchaeota archaeon]
MPQHQLFALIMHESGGDPLMLNLGDDGGSGLGSLQPGIAAHYGLKTYQRATYTAANTAYGKSLRMLVEQHSDNIPGLMRMHEPFDPQKNIMATARYLADLHNYFSRLDAPEPWETALAAYNCGPRRVAAYLRADSALPETTQLHVAKVQKYLAILRKRFPKR